MQRQDFFVSRAGGRRSRFPARRTIGTPPWAGSATGRLGWKGSTPRRRESLPTGYDIMSTPHELGRRGEELAVEWLRAREWTILDRNFRLGRKEIDIVARQGSVV